MYCTICGKCLPEGYKYVVCDICFKEKREELVFIGDKTIAYRVITPIGCSPDSPNEMLAHVQGWEEVSGLSHYEIPTDYYYTKSERACKIKREVAEEKTLRKRMIRLVDNPECKRR